MAAALASVVSSMPLSETSATPGIEVANAKVKAWTRAARNGKGKEAPLGTIFGSTWAGETFEIPHGEMYWLSSARSSELEPDWVSGEPTPPEKPKEHDCLKPGPSPRAVAPEPTSVQVGRLVDSGLGLPRRGVLPRGFCSVTHGPTARAPTKRLPHMGDGRGRREQYPTAGSAQGGNPCSTEVSHSSPSGE